jgi:hypothetical protein
MEDVKPTYIHLMNTMREYLKEPPINSKNKKIRDMHREINEFKRCYQLRSNLVKNENGDLLADFHNILSKWKNRFSQLLMCKMSATLGRQK